ncbi:MAG TPA: hypothetical protein VG943_18415 [Caulobacterales bacterium]|nr:hypothetical protein [Caulobacterales bacterium]
MRIVLAILALALIAAPREARAFGTINGMGQHEEHQRITRAAFSDFGVLTLDELGGRRGRFGAVGAPDNPLRGLLFTDEAHCDNGDHLDAPGYPQSREQAQHNLERCRAWMIQWIERAVRAAAPLAHPDGDNTFLDCGFVGDPGSAKCAVLADLGIALHAAQDFYAHTNWVDRPADSAIGPENPPGLGNQGRAPWLDPRRSIDFPAGLMSGCFHGEPETWFCKYDATIQVRHAVLNKDTGEFADNGAPLGGTTPRGRINGNFQRAIAAAIDDSRDKWAYFQERVIAAYGAENGRRIICVVRSDDFSRCS